MVTHRRTSHKPTVPIAIRINRKRPPPQSGSGYRRYGLETKKMSDYLKLVIDRVHSQQREYGVVSYIAARYPIKRSTLARQWKRWKDDLLSEGLTDTLRAKIDKDNRGGHNKSLTLDEEKLLDTQLEAINEGGQGYNTVVGAYKPQIGYVRIRNTCTCVNIPWIHPN